MYQETGYSKDPFRSVLPCVNLSKTMMCTSIADTDGPLPVSQVIGVVLDS